MGKRASGGGRRTVAARTATARVVHTPMTDGSVERDILEPAFTLRADEIGTNKSGWTIKGEVKDDYYTWVNEFEASHPKLGRVWGDFEQQVYATSERAYRHFVKNHPPESWDYDDI